MKIELAHRHYGVHKFVSEAEIPGEFADYATPVDGKPDDYVIDEEKLLAALRALPDGFLCASPKRTLLVVSDGLGGTGQRGLSQFRDWAKYFDAYVLSLVKAEPAEIPEADRGPDTMQLGTEACREIMRELADRPIMMELPDLDNLPGQIYEWTAAGNGGDRWCILVPTLDMVSVRAQTGSGFLPDLAVLSPGKGQFDKYIFVRHPSDPSLVGGEAHKAELRAAVEKALGALDPAGTEAGS
jgi:hypothetical protein